MLTRRHFNASLAAAGLGACLVTLDEAGGQDVPVIKISNGTGIIDPQLAFHTVGEHPKVGFYRDEGINLDLINMSGAAQGLQTIVAGTIDVSSTAPIVFLETYAKDPGLDLVYVYCFVRTPHWGMAVKPDSPVKTLADLKGKNIGIRNQGDTGYIGARAMFQEIGLDPDKDVDWTSVGEGGPAGQALYRGLIDAMAYWDGGFARIETAGFKLRYLPNTPSMKRLIGQAFNVRRSDLVKRRDVFVRFFRATAKSTVFAYADTDLAIKLHWQVYPESKPKGLSDEVALAQARLVVNSRRDKWIAQPWQADKRLGAMTADEWQSEVGFCGLSGQIKDASHCFSNELLDDVNDFDRGKVLALVKKLKAEMA